MNDGDLRQDNFEDLDRQFGEGVKAVYRALEGVEAAGDHKLERYLRDHRVEGITDPDEIKFRRRFDRLINYYSLVELASLADYLPRLLPENFQKRAISIFKRYAVRRYYEEFYPQLLPRMLRLRLNGEQSLAEQDRRTAIAAFAELLTFVREGEQDPHIAQFLDCMQGYVIDGYSWKDVALVIRDPKVYVKVLEVPPDDQGFMEECAHGFRKFCLFATSFDNFLLRRANLPLLQSGCWHYFSFSFESIEDRLLPELKKGDLKARKWLRVADAELYESTRDAIQCQREQLARLADENYGTALKVALKKTVISRTPPAPDKKVTLAHKSLSKTSRRALDEAEYGLALNVGSDAPSLEDGLWTFNLMPNDERITSDVGRGPSDDLYIELKRVEESASLATTLGGIGRDEAARRRLRWGATETDCLGAEWIEDSSPSSRRSIWPVRALVTEGIVQLSYENQNLGQSFVVTLRLLPFKG